MRITEAEQEIRRRRMLHTAYGLFCAHGIDNISLERVAREAGVSLNSIFRYFASKAELLEQTQAILWNELVECIIGGQEQACAEAPNGLAEMRILLYGFENLYQNHNQYIFFAYEYKAYLMRKGLRLSETSYHAMLKPVRDVFLRALRRGQADGSIATQQSAEKLFILLWGVMRHFVEQLLVHERMYEGESPWPCLFPVVVEKALEALQLPF